MLLHFFLLSFQDVVQAGNFIQATDPDGNRVMILVVADPSKDREANSVVAPKEIEALQIGANKQEDATAADYPDVASASMADFQNVEDTDEGAESESEKMKLSAENLDNDEYKQLLTTSGQELPSAEDLFKLSSTWTEEVVDIRFLRMASLRSRPLNA